MPHRTNPSILASSAMNSSDVSNYYHHDDEMEMELDARHAAHSRQYEHQQQHQFQARIPASGLAQSSEAAGAASGGMMFYPPSTFAAGRMAAQQYSAAPSSIPTSVSTAAPYQSHAGYLDAELEPPPNSANTVAPAASADAYYTGAQGHSHSQSQSQSQYAHSAISSLQSNLHESQSHQDAIPVVPSSGGGGVRPTNPNPPSPTNLAARRHSTSDIGRWKTFATGPFAGRTVRAEITEVQKADLGRKCADPPTANHTSTSTSSSTSAGSNSQGGVGEDGEGIIDPGSRRGKEKEHREREKDTNAETKTVRKDRRPLDPPPVVELHLFESVNHGTPEQYERAIPAEEVEIGGLICQVDLYRVTIPPSEMELASMTRHVAGPGGIGVSSGSAHGHGQTFGSYGHPPGSGASIAMHPHAHHQASQSSYEQQHGFAYPQQTRGGGGMPISAGGVEEDTGSAASPLDAGWESASPISPISPYTFHPHPAPHHAHAHQHHMLNNGQQHVPTLHTLSPPSLSAPIDPDSLPPPSESDKLTRVLFGESYAHACSILDLTGRPALYFVFADLSVKLEGLFRPRYRFFDLFSRTADSSDVPVQAQCFGGAFAVYSTKEFPGLKASTPLTKHLSRWGIRVNIRETERKRRAPLSDGPGAGAGGVNGSSSNGSTRKNASGKEKKRNGNGSGRKTRGGSVAGASSGMSVRTEEDGEENAMTATTTTSGAIPRGVDAPRRYLEGTTRGRGGGASGRGRSTATGISNTKDGEARVRVRVTRRKAD